MFRRLPLTLLTLLLAFSTACTLISPQGAAQQDSARAAESTIGAMQTKAAEQVVVTPAASKPSATPQRPTLRPSATPQPTATRLILPSITPTRVCDQAAFVADLTTADGSDIPAGYSFRKEWRLRNTGTCTWTPDYAIVFDSGEIMGGPDEQRLGVSVIPGGTVDISVILRAPGSPGRYRGYWTLRSAAGDRFGVGPDSRSFFVEIDATEPAASGPGYNFVQNVCAAEWTGSAGPVSCLGKDGDPDGFVLTIKRPLLENGYIDDEPALLTNPPRQEDGWIAGQYPPFTVRAGDRFTAIIGCEHNAKGCAARFRLDYQIDSGPAQTFAAWDETNDGSYASVDVDLSSLAGSNVRFILAAHASGPPESDRALWLQPRITRGEK